MTERPYQFTLRRMFVAMTYVAVASTLAAVVMTIWRDARRPVHWPIGLVGFFGPFAVAALIGAGIGQLFGHTLEGAKNGVAAGVILFFVAYLGPGVVAAICGMF